MVAKAIRSLLVLVVVLGVFAVARSVLEWRRIEDAKASFRRPVTASIDEQDAAWHLGRSLFFEPMLSASGHTACVSCHLPTQAWGDGKAHSTGDAGKALALRTPTLFAAGKLDRLGWIGRFRDTAAVTTFALTSPTNMNLPLATATERLRTRGDYVEAFSAAYGADSLDPDHLVAALVLFVTSIEAVDSPFDRWLAGDSNAISSPAKRGFSIFTGKGGCAACHSGPDLTDGSFHDIGSSADEPGRGKLFQTSTKLQYAFKTPSLRGVAARAPYMHDGSRANLEDVVSLYDKGGIARPSRADDIRPLHLSAREKSDLIAFLQTLTGTTRFSAAR